MRQSNQIKMLAISIRIIVLNIFELRTKLALLTESDCFAGELNQTYPKTSNIGATATIPKTNRINKSSKITPFNGPNGSDVF